MSISSSVFVFGWVVVGGGWEKMVEEEDKGDEERRVRWK